MLGGSSIFNDPFFTSHQESIRQMDSFFNNQFPAMGGLLALPGDNRRQQRRQQQQAQNMQVADRHMFMDPFSHFDSMFSGMRSMMSDMHRAFEQVPRDPNAQVFQQSSFMSYSNTGNGNPKVFQASTSSRQGPGGVRETRKALRDSETGMEKMAVGHHINERGHVIERSRNQKTGEANENQEYINIAEEEVAPFDQEYQEKWHSAMRGIDQRRHVERSRHAPLPDGRRARHAALPEPEHRPRRTSNRRE